MKSLLNILTDLVFFSVLALSAVYILSDVVGVLRIGRDLGGWVVRLFVFGAPLSLVLSTLCLFMVGGSRYKWYTWVSGIEVMIVVLIFLIIYKSQI
jgi:predicted DCC family thiol-disulfide oxidoreductase YuxK